MPPLPEGYTRIAGYERYRGPGAIPDGFPPVPGVGPILGIRHFGGCVLAIRSDGETPVLYVAAKTDWQKVMVCDGNA